MNQKVQNTEEYFLSYDWGNTSFRLNLVEMKTEKIVAQVSNSDGIKRVFENWSFSDKSQTRVEYYLARLNKHISKLKKKTTIEIDHIPIIISGMASSSIGIKELPYRNLPVAIEVSNLYVETIKTTDKFNHDIYLISGLKSSSDIIRGEETQVLGLYSKLNSKDGLFLIPGTHSKHIFVEDSHIISFKTYMTGEVFDLLSKQSILAESISLNTLHKPGSAFRNGVKIAIEENILSSLFKIRVDSIFDKVNGSGNYERLSGLLIGTELKVLLRNELKHIFLLGNQNLQKYYSKALDLLNLDYKLIELALQEDISTLGHCIIMNRITAVRLRIC